MSKMKRYTYEVDDGVFAECVLGEDYDAAQSELAALREELATAKRNEHNSEVAYKAAIEKQEELRAEPAESGRADHLRQRIAFLTTEVHAMSERMKAADQRNAELEKLLRQSHGVFVAIKDGLGLMDGFAVSTTIGQIETALKPTESEVSE